MIENRSKHEVPMDITMLLLSSGMDNVVLFGGGDGHWRWQHRLDGRMHGYVGKFVYQQVPGRPVNTLIVSGHDLVWPDEWE